VVGKKLLTAYIYYIFLYIQNNVISCLGFKPSLMTLIFLSSATHSLHLPHTIHILWISLISQSLLSSPLISLSLSSIPHCRIAPPPSFAGCCTASLNPLAYCLSVSVSLPQGSFPLIFFQLIYVSQLLIIWLIFKEFRFIL
jgi:hypothetical protein